MGEVNAMNQFQVSTELGDGVANLKITYTAPTDIANPVKASVETIIGSARTVQEEDRGHAYFDGWWGHASHI